MPFWSFLIYSAIGSAVWVSLLAYAGYFLGANYDRVGEYLKPISTIALRI
jgi:membrane protein DedA with SNARE-associated domain